MTQYKKIIIIALVLILIISIFGLVNAVKENKKLTKACKEKGNLRFLMRDGLSTVVCSNNSGETYYTVLDESFNHIIMRKATSQELFMRLRR